MSTDEKFKLTHYRTSKRFNEFIRRSAPFALWVRWPAASSDDYGYSGTKRPSCPKGYVILPKSLEWLAQNGIPTEPWVEYRICEGAGRIIE